MQLNEAHIPAIRQSWSRESIRAIVRELQLEHGDSSREQLVRLLDQRISDDDRARRAAAEYIVDAALNAQNGYAKRQTSSTPNLSSRASARREAVEQIKNQILRLNEILTNGKRARYCTRDEIETHAETQANDAAGWRRVAKKIPIGKTLGQIFDETELVKLFNK